MLTCVLKNIFYYFKKILDNEKKYDIFWVASDEKSYKDPK
jgi:hypothetical protein